MATLIVLINAVADRLLELRTISVADRIFFEVRTPLRRLTATHMAQEPLVTRHTEKSSHT